MIRVALLTSEPLLARGLAAVLSAEPDTELVFVAETAKDLLKLGAARLPDLLLIDSPEQPTQEWLIELRLLVPPACRFILWVRTVTPEFAHETMRIGVRGILRKTLNTEAVIRCLKSVAAGECWFEEQLTAGLLNSTPIALSPRELELIELVAQGLRNKEIAGRLMVSEPTIRLYLTRLFRKLGVNDRIELAILSLKDEIPQRMRLDRDGAQRELPSPSMLASSGTGSMGLRRGVA